MSEGPNAGLANVGVTRLSYSYFTATTAKYGAMELSLSERLPSHHGGQ